ncbi:MAG: PTS sugar transporter subunit IIA [Planctomycetes bacterium]|nr:PTS sugar transporter subunit IIA [Planctomycetota bacterium]
MRLRDHIDQSLIFVDLRAADKAELLEELVRRASSRFPGIDSADLLRRLSERERQVSTGVGKGIAIPHTAVAGLERTVCLLARVPDGVAFDSIDLAPVRFVFLLLSPPNTIGQHLKLLARISRVVGSDAFVKAVLRAENPREIYDLVVEEDARHVD